MVKPHRGRLSASRPEPTPDDPFYQAIVEALTGKIREVIPEALILIRSNTHINCGIGVTHTLGHIVPVDGVYVVVALGYDDIAMFSHYDGIFYEEYEQPDCFDRVLAYVKSSLDRPPIARKQHETKIIS